MEPVGATSAAHRPVGVFDSGIGGLSILRSLRTELPGEDFIYLADAAHAPYGERGDDHVIARTRAIVQRLRREHAVKALVIACNTATAAAIHLIRRDHPDLPVVGVEPALKPAVAISASRRIGVMATRGTLASAKLRALHDSLGGQAEFILQPCDGLAEAIEKCDDARIASLCELYTRAIGRFGTGQEQVDTLVLGCTHYPFAQAQIRHSVGPQVQLIETGTAVARQTRNLLGLRGQLQAPERQGSVTLLSTGSDHALATAASRWLGL